MVELAAGILDEGAGEEIEEGESVLLLELTSDVVDSVTLGGGDRLAHGDLLGVGLGGRNPPPSYHPGRSLSSKNRIGMKIVIFANRSRTRI
jgi:hypothetical protein